jgi:hypothetical protein
LQQCLKTVSLHNETGMLDKSQPVDKDDSPAINIKSSILNIQ